MGVAYTSYRVYIRNTRYCMQPTIASVQKTNSRPWRSTVITSSNSLDQLYVVYINIWICKSGRVSSESKASKPESPDHAHTTI